VRLKVKGQEVLVERIPEVPWKGRLQRLACFQRMAFASYVLNWYLGPQ